MNQHSKRLLRAAIALCISLIVCDRAFAAVTIVGGVSSSDTPGVNWNRTVIIQRHQEKIVEDSRVTLIDADRDEVILLNQITRTYTVSRLTPPPTFPIAARMQPPHGVFRGTGAGRAIIGYECEIFDKIVHTPKGNRKIEACFAQRGPGVAEYMNFYANLASKIHQNGTNASATNVHGLPMTLSTTFEPKYVFPPSMPFAQVQAIEQRLVHQPPIVTTEWITKVSVVHVPESIFAIPPGYTKLHLATLPED
jgi:hypothetical protein